MSPWTLDSALVDNQVPPGERTNVSHHLCLADRDRRLSQRRSRVFGAASTIIDAFAAYLSERVAKDKGVALNLKTLKNAEATREAVVDGFRTHLGKAQKGDVAVFCYSGHGSQEQAPEEFWKIEPDHLDETLVCFDSRNPGNWDLADKELAKLINDVAAKGPHVAVILDCCHSGSGTREIGTVVRRAPTDLRRRPIESFLVSVAEAQAAAASRDASASSAAWSIATEGRHVLLAACRDDEEAKEYIGDGQHRGAISFFLGDALKSAAGVPTYRDLFARAPHSSAIRSRTSRPSSKPPGMTTSTACSSTAPSSRHPPPSRPASATAAGPSMAAGPTAFPPPAVPTPSGSPFSDSMPPPTSSATRPRRSRPPSWRKSSRRRAGSRSRATPSSTRAQTYKALIISLPAPALAVSAGRGRRGLRAGQKAVASASPEGKPSLFIRVAAQGENPEFRLIARNGQFVITKPNDDRPLVAQIDGLNEAGARLAVQRLEHIARWTQTARLSNPSQHDPARRRETDHPGRRQRGLGREIRLEYQIKDGKAAPAHVPGQHDQQQPANPLLRPARPDPTIPGRCRTAQSRLREDRAGSDGVGQPRQPDPRDRPR